MNNLTVVKNDSKTKGLKMELAKIIRGLKADIEETSRKIEKLYYSKRILETEFLIAELEELLEEQQRSLKRAMDKYAEIA